MTTDATDPRYPGWDVPAPPPPTPGPGAGDGPDSMGRVPWGLLDALGVIAVAGIVIVVAVFAVVVLTAFDAIPEALAPILVPLPLFVLGVITAVWVQARHRAARRLLGPRGGGLREWGVGLGIGAAGFVVVNFGVAVVLQVLAELAGMDLPQPQEGVQEAVADPALLPWLVVSVVLVAPIAEELFFRGMLHQALRRRLGRWAAIVSSAVVFAAAHVIQELGGGAGPVAFVLILPLGVLLGWLFEWRGNLTAPIVVHATYNLLVVVLMTVPAG